jgi:hypothetical protein
MSIRDALGRVMREYAEATTQTFAKHPLAQFIRDPSTEAQRALVS